MSRRTMRSSLLGLAAAVVAALVPVAPSSAAIHITSFGFSATNQDGSPAQQAGAHPYEVTTAFTVASHDDGSGNLLPDESARNLVVDLPAGLVGNPTATPLCAEPLI